MLKGRLELYEKDEEGEYTKLVRTSPNLYVDDGKELTLDFLFGIQSWWNPLPQASYGSGNIGWDTRRYIGIGLCMFNNSSAERASGLNAIATGAECQYPVSTTYLVDPEDSFLSREATTSRVVATCTRRDQTVEIKGFINVPGNIPILTVIREFGIFLSATGPDYDPSYVEADRPDSIICRSALYGTGWYKSSGGTCTPCAESDAGAELCYYDDPYKAMDDVQFRWVFGEL
jgi:hypothetical protein